MAGKTDLGFSVEIIDIDRLHFCAKGIALLASAHEGREGAFDDHSPWLKSHMSSHHPAGLCSKVVLFENGNIYCHIVVFLESITSFSLYNASYTPSWGRMVSLKPRNKMDVGARYSLARRLANVHTDIEPVRR